MEYVRPASPLASVRPPAPGTQLASMLPPAPAPVPSTPAQAFAIEEITEAMKLSSPYATGSPAAPAPSPAEIKAEPLDEPDIEAPGTAFLNRRFGGAPHPQVKKQLSTPPAPSIKPEPVPAEDDEIKPTHPAREGFAPHTRPVASRTALPARGPQRVCYYIFFFL